MSDKNPISSTNYNLTDKFEEVIRGQIAYASSLINQRAWRKLDKFLHTTDYHEVASIIKSLSATDKVIVFRLLKEKMAIDVFMCLDGDEQEKLLYAFSDAEAGLILAAMDPDDRTRLLGDLPPTVVTKLLRLLPMHERKIANTLLNYPEHSAGRIMTPEFLAFSPDITAEEALQLIKLQSSQKETIYTSYIVNKSGELVGFVPLADIIFAPEKKRLKDLMKDNSTNATVETDQEEVARLMNYYDLMVIPITDKHHRLVGIVTHDDIVDIIHAEATEDFHRFTGINPSEVSYLSSPIWSLVLNRSCWVMILLFIAGFSQDILLRYGGILQDQWIDLSLFFTVLVGVGGNIGSQSSILVIRGISTGEITQSNMVKLMWRALFTGLCMGLLLSGILLFRIFIFKTGSSVRWAAALSMVLIVMVSNFLGAVLPLLLKRINVDPAIVSAPLIATIMDLGGLILYLEVANHLLR